MKRYLSLLNQDPNIHREFDLSKNGHSADTTKMASQLLAARPLIYLIAGGGFGQAPTLQINV